MKLLTFIFLLFAQMSFAQKDLLQQTISKIEWEQDSIQSVYNWVAQNVQYDISKLNQIVSPGKSKIRSSARNEEEHQTELLNKVLRSKKGVCEDYSILFQAMIAHLGYKSYIVQGYTRDSEGKINRKFGHTWNAVYSDDKWKFYDPTWGAGHVINGSRFKKLFSKEWSNVAPAEMIKTHMPFDPIWQLMDNPITYEAFEKNTGENLLEAKYDYKNLALAHCAKGRKQQMIDEVERSTELGSGARLIAQWQRSTQKNIAMYGIHSQPDLINKTADLANGTVELFNKYIAAKNKQFKVRKWTKKYSKGILLKAELQIQSVIDVFNGIEVDDKKANRFLQKSLEQAETMLDHIKKEIVFVDNHTF